MDFVKLGTKYYREGALLRAGEAAEVLWCRAKAYAGEMETDGFIPTEALPTIIATKAKSRVAALVREGLLEAVDGGWLITTWAHERQETKASLEQKREAGRLRVQRHRTKPGNGVTAGERNAVTNTERRSTEVEVERSAAAAAPRETPLPPPLEILRAHLEAAKLIARWDTLTAAEHIEIEQLIDLHGDSALVKSALTQHQPAKPAAFARAWLGAWRQLRPPSAGLGLVADARCDKPGHQGTVRHCIECASERHEAGTR